MRSDPEQSNYRVNVDSREICTGKSNGPFTMPFGMRCGLDCSVSDKYCSWGIIHGRCS